MARNANNARGPYRKVSLESRLERNSIPEPNSGCLLWLGFIGRDGYARLSIILAGKQTSRLAHVVAYELTRGEVPDGLELDHRCRTRCCVNPEHLQPVTHQVNVLRGDGVAARRALQTTCSAGHPLSGENLYVDPRGSRRCRQCARRNAERHAEVQ